ncbi:MAG: DUF4292 domain-containing protein [Prevotellaceae bacterium]|nr:DUF4292 domain-containing protein [Candidatus Minthosoma equi]
MKIKSSTIKFAVLSLMVLLMASCHSSKKMHNGDDSDKKNNITTIDTKKGDKKNGVSGKDQVTIADGTNFTARVRVKITKDGKDISTSGNLRMRYNDVIQLTLADPILGITEVGRMELSPSSMLIIDRINKRYVESTYSEFAAFKSNNIDFAKIQDFFWQQAQTSNEFSYDIPAKSSIKLDLKLSDKGSSSNWETHTSVSSKYTKTDANRLFNSLVGQ